jgi:hypothetical protein
MLPRQEDLETAIGQLQRAARQHGDTPTGLELQELALRAKRLRDPDIVKRVVLRKPSRAAA